MDRLNTPPPIPCDLLDRSDYAYSLPVPDGSRWRRWAVRENSMTAPRGLREIWISKVYFVQVFELPADQGWTRIGILKCNQTEIRESWSEIQRIKNEILGAEADAIEIYPAESDLVNDAPMRWLITPPDRTWPDPRVWRTARETPTTGATDADHQPPAN